jgi:hypothetical protein
MTRSYRESVALTKLTDEPGGCPSGYLVVLIQSVIRMTTVDSIPGYQAVPASHTGTLACRRR